MKKLALIILLLFLFVIPYALSAGTCNLNKNDYIPGEMATLECSCSLANEENRAGYIVFIHDNGTILYNSSTNSNSCTTGFFGGTYTFSNLLTDYNGTAIFSLNADGTGVPLGWTSIDDIREDYWTVNGSSTTDCLIEFEIPENQTPTFDLGKFASLGAEIKDGSTFGKIVNARCNLHLESTNDVHILTEPYNPPNSYSLSNGGGEVTFERNWDTNTINPYSSYLVKVYCYCPINDTTPCYYSSGSLVGTETGFKTCNSELIINSGKDFRFLDENKGNLTGTMLFFILLVIFYAGFGVHTYQKADPDVSRIDYWISFLCFNLATLMLFVALGIVHAYNTGKDFTILLNITLISNGLIIFLGGFVIWLRHLIGMASYPSEDLRKWDKGKWEPKN